MSSFQYSSKYTSDQDNYEYRTVLVFGMTINRVLSETEWRSLGVQQSAGWENYAIYAPDNVMLFRRLKSTK